MSQAEKRAKQLEGMGIEEKDITDVDMVPSKKRDDQPPADAKTSGAAAVKTTAAQNNASSTQAEKDKKGIHSPLSDLFNNVTHTFLKASLSYKFGTTDGKIVCFQRTQILL